MKNENENDLRREAIFPSKKEETRDNFRERYEQKKVKPFRIKRINGRYVRVPIHD